MFPVEGPSFPGTWNGVDISPRIDSREMPLMIDALHDIVKSAGTLIETGAGVDAKRKDGKTALMYAVETRCVDSVRALINAGADVNAKVEIFRKTALMIAGQFGCVDSVRALIDAGADVNAKDFNGKTALMYAAETWCVDSVRALIDAGAYVNAKDEERKTALIYAVETGCVDSVRALINAGGDANAKDFDGKTALMYAVETRCVDSVRALIDAGGDVNAKDFDGKTTLMYAVETRCVDSVRALIDAGADVNAKDFDGKTALMYALESRCVDSVRALIDAGADVNAKDDDRKTALIYAAETGCVDSVRALIDAGGDANARDFDGKTAFMYAVETRCVDSLRALIDAGAGNAKDFDGTTALMYAVKNRCVDSLRALIDAGADGNAKSEIFGKTALMYALESRCVDSVRALINAGADDNEKDFDGKTALMYAVEIRCVDSVRALIDASADVNAKDFDGKTTLMYAVETRCFDSVHALIDAAADVNAKNQKGETALFGACRFACNYILQLLIEKNADVKVTNKDSQTALFCIENCFSPWIFRDEFNDHCETCTSMLLSAGIPVYTKDRFGDTALHCLVKKGITGACKLLIEKDRALVNATDKNGRTPIHYAILRYDTVVCPFDVVRSLLAVMGASIVHDDALLVFWIEVCLNNGIDLNSLFRFVSESGFSSELINDSIWNFYACQIFNVKDHHSHADKVADYLKSGNEKIIEVLKIPTWERAVELLHLLIKRGVNLNTVDSEGNTILHYSTLLPFHGVPQDIVMEILTLLGKSMKNIRVRNNEKESPLLFCLSRATQFGLRRNNRHEPKRMAIVEVCRSLLETSPADCNETNERGQTVFHLIMKIFQGAFVLNNASRALALDEAMKLLELFSPLTITRGVTANKRDDENQNSPLHLWATLSLPSVQEYHKTLTDDCTYEGVLAKILTHFLSCGAMVNARNLTDQTPLHLCKTWSAAKLLIGNKARKNDVDCLERPPLLAAAHAKLFKDPNAKAKFYPDVKDDPFSFFKACRTEHGLDLWATDANGNSILSVLLECEEFELSRDLVQLACEEVESELTNMLETVCKDGSAHSYWKTTIIDNILISPKSRLNSSKALRYCCKNLKSAVQCSDIDWAETVVITPLLHYIPEIKRVKYEDSNEETAPSVHLEIAERLLSYGVDENERKDLARDFPELQILLTVHIDDSKIPVMIPWQSQSKVHKAKLHRVARRQNFTSTASCCYHEEPIGKGAFGYVFAGIRNDGREVAVKRIEKLTVAQLQIKREISILIDLAHCKHVVEYLSFDGKEENFDFICLELMEGNLDDYLDSSIFDRSKNTSLCKQVLIGLHFLHQLKICHRDLKPVNILYRTHPELILKIADFGLSRNMDIVASYSVMNSTVGTRGWIAPESAKNKEYTTCSDMFAFGLVVHYIMSGKKHPFSPKECSYDVCAETEVNIVHNCKTLDGNLHPETTNLLLKLLKGDPNERPSAAKALDHPMFWSAKEKIDFLIAVGEEFRTSDNRAIRRVKEKLETRFTHIVKQDSWIANDYEHMSEILKVMKEYRAYNVKKAEDLLILLKNAKAHFKDQKCNPIGKYLLDDFVYLKNFPELVMEVFEIVIETHKWDKTKLRIRHALRNEASSNSTEDEAQQE